MELFAGGVISIRFPLQVMLCITTCTREANLEQIEPEFKEGSPGFS